MSSICFLVEKKTSHRWREGKKYEGCEYDYVTDGDIAKDLVVIAQETFGVGRCAGSKKVIGVKSAQ